MRPRHEGAGGGFASGVPARGQLPAPRLRPANVPIGPLPGHSPSYVACKPCYPINGGASAGSAFGFPLGGSPAAGGGSRAPYGGGGGGVASPGPPPRPPTTAPGW